MHAAGVIMSSEPLIDIIPIMKREQDGAIITQFDYPTCEGLGLVKMDFLGLRNLTVLDDALRNIVLNGKDPVELETLTLDDPATFELLARGDTLGVFQLDGGPMRALLRSMRPDKFEDISAVGALYRPGPMGMNSHNEYADRKNKRKPVVALHPELEAPLAEILGETYGLIVYQEQVMAVAQKVAGLLAWAPPTCCAGRWARRRRPSWTRSTRRSRPGWPSAGSPPGAIKALWDTLLPFSDYAFNKAHSAAYGLVSYWTAFLKANYPAEYMAALLTSVRDDKDKSALYLGECRRMGIKVLPPDVNESSAEFTAVGTDIRFGLAAIRNVGANVVEKIAEARAGQGPLHLVQGLPAQGRRRRLQQAHRRVADQGRARSTPSGRAARRSPTTTSGTSRPPSPPSPATRTRARCSTSTSGRARSRSSTSSPGCPSRSAPSGRRPRCWPSSATCSGSTSPTTRCSASSTSWPGWSTRRSPGSWPTTRGRTARC